MNFVKSKKILHQGQYGFQERLSTSLALMELTEEITTSMDQSKHTLGVFIDLKKAFDTIDHKILVGKLMNYGIRGIAIKWIASYLNNRSQFVSINNVESEKQTIVCGVPQGSVLGPSLFILYVNDMGDASSVLKSILFADDTNLFYTGRNITEMCNIVTKELEHLNQWFMVNKLSLNVEKTNFMIFSNGHITGDHRVIINGNIIGRVYTTKFLGVHIDAKLTWDEHIRRVKTTISKNISVMFKLKYVLNNKSMYSLYCSLILPYLNYCNIIWGNNYVAKIDTLIKLQKRALRIVANVEYLGHTKPIFIQYNTLRLDDLIKLNSMCLMFKVINNMLPDNLSKYFVRVNMTHDYQTRQCNNMQIQFCRTTKRSYAISVLGPKIWNQLPDKLRSINQFYNFKVHYKRFLLKLYSAI